MLLTQQVRQAFIDFFISKHHTLYPSSSLLTNDASLLFTNAGMIQFKDWFINPELAQDKQIVTCQKVLRVSGKHNDFDNVGYTLRHHTFFEMLGNFSFNSYFKEEAITFAYEFLTQVIGLQASKLMYTVYHDDEVSHQLWRKVAGQAAQIRRIATDDNFWRMGDSGPCGPCSEIFIESSKDPEGYTELWNLVFMQYNQEAGKLTNLKYNSIDTGMGLERLVSVLQGVYDNYQIDSIKPLMDTQLARLRDEKNINEDYSYVPARVVTDHVRAACMLILDGLTPSNEGAGYVLRRILRRAMRYLQKQNALKPYLHSLVSLVITSMHEAYPLLTINEAHIKQTILNEEEKFAATLQQGLKLLDHAIKQLSSNEDDKDSCKQLSGEVVFKLYDTFGFPIDLTEVILQEQGLSFDKLAFENLLLKQKEQSKWHKQQSNIGAVEITPNLPANSVEFVGYEQLGCQTKLLYYQIDGDKLFFITETTPFYATSGGQEGDIGEAKFIIKGDKEVILPIIETIYDKSQNTMHISSNTLEATDLAVGMPLTLIVDIKNRSKVAQHHTGTHLLQAALRKHLGKHVMQKGSYVDGKKLRFDFTHTQAISPSELQQISNEVNEMIASKFRVQVEYMPLEAAIKQGAMAFFGEKYAHIVRTIAVKDLDENHVSFELCGGTHVNNTAEIGAFYLITCYSIASGIKRIEAVCGTNVATLTVQQEEVLNHLAKVLKCPRDDLLSKATSLMVSAKPTTITPTRNYHFSNWQVSLFEAADLQALKAMQKDEQIFLNLDGTKLNVLLKSKLMDAKILLSQILPIIDGKGGGKANFAQGGGICENIEDFIQQLQRILQ